MIEIKKYTPACAREWNTFVESSRQGTFLLNRGYMDYHSHRFEDCSLMAYDAGRLVGVLPGNVEGDELWSHRGLTYGGWLTPVKGFDASAMLRLWRSMTDFLSAEGVKRLHYKTIPSIYARCPAEEDVYALFRTGASVETCSVSAAIDLRNPVPFDSNAMRNMRKARANGLVVEADCDLSLFWPVLEQVLSERYGVAPVHSLGEMELLKSRFPENIRVFAVRDPAGEVLAGTVMYLTEKVAHAQYIASSPRGKALGALPLLFHHLVGLFAGMDWFDFGISCEQGGRYLNEGLLRQKSGFGGRCVNYVSYVLNINEIIW